MADESSPRLAPEIAQPGRTGRPLELPVSGETEPLVLARGNLFCVTNQRGDIAPAGARDLGLFCEDTRHLSYLELLIAGGPPLVLSADTAGASSAQVDLTLTDSEFGGFLSDPQNFLHIRRKQILDGDWVDQMVLTNHLQRAVDLWLELRMAADFADVFEVRGVRRRRRGILRPPQHAGDRLILSYTGVDGEEYRTVIRFSPEPRRLGPTGPFWDLRLEPGEATVLEVVVQAMRGAARERERVPFDVRHHRQRARHRGFMASTTGVRADNTVFQGALANSLEDLDALRLDVDGRRIVGAGIPWFAAPFGRDSLITSLEVLTVAPQLAAETLRTLAAYQGARDDPWREEEPGRIMHELRRGELTRTGEAPHSPYYGTVDATPLFVVLFGEAWRWLGDRELVRELMPHAERALAWVERRLEAGGGFVRYQRTHERGLENQGWKDSRDGVSFPDGRVARPPIALVEVQGYAVAAFDALARVKRDLGDADAAQALTERAGQLRRAIQEAFWVPETGYYALALDGDDQRVATLASNAGHLLYGRAIDEVHAGRVVDVLMGDSLFSGFGVRTVGRGQPVYNPLSYHNGSVWPHDNALCALGAAGYGRSDLALALLEGLFAASRHFRRQRLPELFCGLGRADGDFLVHYPVSCSPQAWAAGAPFMLLQAALGLRGDAPARTLTVVNPMLPAFLDEISLLGLRVGDSHVSLRFVREGTRTHVDVLQLTAHPLRVRIEIG